MLYSKLGRTGLIVSRLSFGAMTFSDGAVRMPNLDRIRADGVDAIVGQALDAGINFFDTADVYAYGESEMLLGRALAPYRDRVVIATKAGTRTGEDHNGRGLSRTHLLNAIDKSLARLGTDYVDVYICHRADPLTPLEETLSTLDQIVRSGKARYLGFSNWPAWMVSAALEMQRANGWAPFTHGQMSYSLLDRDIEHDVVPMMRHFGIGLTVWSPLSSGFLSGKYTPDNISDPANRLSASIWHRFDFERGFAVVDRLRPIAEAKGASVAQVALAWLLAKDEVSSVILGAAKPSQLADNLGAVNVALDPAEIAELDALTAPVPIYPNNFLAATQDKAIAAALARRPGDKD